MKTSSEWHVMIIRMGFYRDRCYSLDAGKPSAMLVLGRRTWWADGRVIANMSFLFYLSFLTKQISSLYPFQVLQQVQPAD